MTQGTRPVLTHSSTRMMKLATGVARTTRMAGESTQSAAVSQWVAAAARAPRRTPMRAPKKIRSRLRAALRQNRGVKISSPSSWTTDSGEGINSC